MSFRYWLSSVPVVVLAAIILLAGCKPPPAQTDTNVLQIDGTPDELCVEGSVNRSQDGDKIELNCDLRLVKLQFLAHDAPPGAVFAKIECSCEDTPAGGIACRRCTCQEDEASNCKSFLAWCTATGGEALGGGDIGICNKP